MNWQFTDNEEVSYTEHNLTANVSLSQNEDKLNFVFLSTEFEFNAIHLQEVDPLGPFSLSSEIQDSKSCD